jgi:outer membrane biogenesis lipoprotein LolB
VLKSCTSFCTEAFLRRCVRPSIATVSRLAARATRACARRCQSWKVQYSNWAQEFMFRPARLSAHTEAPPARRPAVRARSQQWLKARFLR